jgi:hypothetical protein
LDRFFLPLWKFSIAYEKKIRRSGLKRFCIFKNESRKQPHCQADTCSRHQFRHGTKNRAGRWLHIPTVRVFEDLFTCPDFVKYGFSKFSHYKLRLDCFFFRMPITFFLFLESTTGRVDICLPSNTSKAVSRVSSGTRQ